MTNSKTSKTAFPAHLRNQVLHGNNIDLMRTLPDACFDMIFADPPYDMPGIQSLPDRLLPWLKPGGKLLIEHKPQVQFAQPSEQTRTYGSTTITIFVQA